MPAQQQPSQCAGNSACSGQPLCPQAAACPCSVIRSFKTSSAAHLTATHVTRSLCPNSAQRGRGSSGNGCRPRTAAGYGASHRMVSSWGRCTAVWTEVKTLQTWVVAPCPPCCQLSSPRSSTALSCASPRPKAGLASQTISVVSALPLTITRPSASVRERGQQSVGVLNKTRLSA